MKKAPTRRGRYFVSEADDSNPETRIGKRIQPQPNGCWIFNGHPDQYGTVQNTWLPGRFARPVPAHRYVYEILVGPIPVGHVLHHECQTPGCVNPQHLVPLTPAQHCDRHDELDVGSLSTRPPLRR